MRISDWSSDVCSSDLVQYRGHGPRLDRRRRGGARGAVLGRSAGPAGRSRARTLNGAGGVAGTMAAPQQKPRSPLKCIAPNVTIEGWFTGLHNNDRRDTQAANWGRPYTLRLTPLGGTHPPPPTNSSQ